MNRWARALLPPFPLTLRHPWVPGARVRVDLRRHTTYWKRGLAAYEPHVAALLARIVGRDDVVVEVGTHVGYFTLLLAARARRVLALEPDPENRRRTEDNLRRNAVGNVVVLPVAAADRTGPGRFVRDAATGATGHLVEGGPARGASDVALVRLDDLVARELGGAAPALVKIDAEGAEDSVLAGMGALLDGLTDVLVEVGDATRAPVQARLRAHGYRLFNPYAGVWQPEGTTAGWHVLGTKRGAILP